MKKIYFVILLVTSFRVNAQHNFSCRCALRPQKCVVLPDGPEGNSCAGCQGEERKEQEKRDAEVAKRKAEYEAKKKVEDEAEKARVAAQKKKESEYKNLVFCPSSVSSSKDKTESKTEKQGTTSSSLQGESNKTVGSSTAAGNISKSGGTGVATTNKSKLDKATESETKTKDEAVAAAKLEASLPPCKINVNGIDYPCAPSLLLPGVDMTPEQQAKVNMINQNAINFHNQVVQMHNRQIANQQLEQSVTEIANYVANTINEISAAADASYSRVSQESSNFNSSRRQTIEYYKSQRKEVDQQLINTRPQTYHQGCIGVYDLEDYLVGYFTSNTFSKAVDGFVYFDYVKYKTVYTLNNCLNTTPISDGVKYPLEAWYEGGNYYALATEGCHVINSNGTEIDFLKFKVDADYILKASNLHFYFAVYNDNYIDLYKQDGSTYRKVKSLYPPQAEGGNVKYINFSPDDKYVAYEVIREGYNMLYVYDLMNKKVALEKKILQGYNSTFSIRGQYIMANDVSGKFTRWNLATGNEESHADIAMPYVKISDNGSFIYSWTDSKNALYIYNTSDYSLRLTIPMNIAPECIKFFNQDHYMMAVVPNNIYIFDMTTGNVIKSMATTITHPVKLIVTSDEKKFYIMNQYDLDMYIKEYNLY
jgi:hypothetical protein